MKPHRSSAALLFSLCLGAVALAHDLRDPENPHPRYDWSVVPPAILLAQAANSAEPIIRTDSPRQAAAAFLAFAPKVSVRMDANYLYIESDGLPAHEMMVGITNWQRQVPLPQSYFGPNAWRIPRAPVPAQKPVSIRGRFLRGAIAIAANGIPIFNPQNNRGEISAEIGELDQFGGHCGRADDYHYHAAPLHLQTVLGPKLPIAYALDGYPIYGLTEPDGSAPAGLDELTGHSTPGLGYHYHASTKYPYVNGGFHGEVTERGGQVDPQPRAEAVRPAGEPLRGAKITGFESVGPKSHKLTYELNGKILSIVFTVNPDGTFPFVYDNGSAGTVRETYSRRERGAEPPAEGVDPAPPRETGRPAESGSTIGMDEMKKPSPTFVLTSPEVTDGGTLPNDFTGDGSGATLPLAWKGAPAGTQSYALVMDHLAPGNVVKTYWTMWDLDATTISLPKNARGIGKIGPSFKGMLGYEPPRSQGPGPKTYVLTIYALSAPPGITAPPATVTRDVLLTAIKDKVLASASLHVVHTRGEAPPNRAPF